jgi:hypothetical protein
MFIGRLYHPAYRNWGGNQRRMGAWTEMRKECSLRSPMSVTVWCSYKFVHSLYFIAKPHNLQVSSQNRRKKQKELKTGTTSNLVRLVLPSGFSKKEITHYSCTICPLLYLIGTICLLLDSRVSIRLPPIVVFNRTGGLSRVLGYSLWVTSQHKGLLICSRSSICSAGAWKRIGSWTTLLQGRACTLRSIVTFQFTGN